MGIASMVLSSEQAGATPSIVPILLPEGFARFGDAVLSADGSTVVGGARQSGASPGSPGFLAFVWTRADGTRSIGELGPDAPDPTWFEPSSVSGDGSRIAGWLENVPVVWEREVGTTVLPSLPAGTSPGSVRGISDDGRYVVGSAHDGGTTTRIEQLPGGGIVVIEAPRLVPVRWDLESDSVTALSTDRGVAYDVSDGGVAVGELDIDYPGLAGSIAAFRWDESGGPQFVPTGYAAFSPGWTDDVTRISADGSTLVGRNIDEAPAGVLGDLVQRAYAWSGEPGSDEHLPSEGLVLLDTPLNLNGVNRAQATGVSADGSTIVGNYNAANAISSPFVWTREAGFQDLVVLLTTLGVSMDAWRSLTVTDVSADGKTIIGSGRFSSGVAPSSIVTFVAVIPEPSTALLLGLGLSVLGARARPRRSRRATR